MNQRPEDWDADEHETLEAFERELAGIRRRHANDPSPAMLRAADEDALPSGLQAQVARHLEDGAWSRAVVDGLRAVDDDVRLDAASEQRLFDRITNEAQAAPSRRRWHPAILFGGLALAATVAIAVVVSRSGRFSGPAPAPSLPAGSSGQASAGMGVPSAGEAPIRIAFSKPEVKLSASALTWRGDASANPFLRDLAPAIEAYRASDYARAVAAFDRLATVYPDSIDVLFYQGVSRMLAGDDAGAIAPLEAAARVGDATFADDVRWFLAVAQQRSGRPEARDRLSELCRGQGRHAAAACAAVTQLATPSSSPRQP